MSPTMIEAIPTRKVRLAHDVPEGTVFDVFVFDRRGKFLARTQVAPEGVDVPIGRIEGRVRVFVTPADVIDKKRPVQLADLLTLEAAEIHLDFPDGRPVPNPVLSDRQLEKLLRLAGVHGEVVSGRGLPLPGVRVHIVEFRLTYDMNLRRRPAPALWDIVVKQLRRREVPGLPKPWLTTDMFRFELEPPHPPHPPGPWPLGLEVKELATVETNAYGRFRRIVLALERRPDLYFWVEALVNGKWTKIQIPDPEHAVYWDYAGEKVLLRIDSELVAEGVAPAKMGRVAEVIQIGATAIEHLDANGSLDGQPLGGTIVPVVDFAYTELGEVARYYGWQYRPAGGGDWTPLRREVLRHYAKCRKENGETKHTLHVYSLGPRGRARDRFEIPPVLPPVPDGSQGWWLQLSPHDSASAYFESDKPAPLAGDYLLRLELFADEDGPPLTFAENDSPFAIPSAIPDADGSNPAVPPPSWMLETSEGRVNAFVMKLNVDNLACAASLGLPFVKGATASECGMLSVIGKDALLSIPAHAAQPNGHFTIEMTWQRAMGSANACTPPEVAGRPSVDFEITDQVSRFLGACSSGASFLTVLHVRSTATDGYDRLDHLDAYAQASFALIHES